MLTEFPQNTHSVKGEARFIAMDVRVHGELEEDHGEHDQTV
jgi:hypothetical protein